MKNLFYYILSLNIFLNLSAFCQTTDLGLKSDEVWIYIEDSKNYPIAKDSIKTLNKNINNLLLKHKVHQYEKAFPFSKNEELKKVYQLRFKGDIQELTKDLKTSGIQKIIYRPVEVNVALYEPTDYGWYAPPGDWLWHLKKIQADKAWDITKGDPNIKIAIIDTWFDITHPDLVDRFSPTKDPFDNTQFGKNAGANGHGTNVASFAGAKTDGGDLLASTGFNCTLIGYQAWVGSYIQRAQHASLVMHADVLTSSAGGWSCTSIVNEAEKLAVKEILDNGTIIVFPAGNGPNDTHCNYNGSDHSFKPLSPEYDERIILVTSTDKDDKHQFIEGSIDFTHSHFPEVDICSPGYNVMGAKPTLNSDGTTNTWPFYGGSKGTSFATPIVAGICGLMKSVNPCITPAEAQDIIKNNADPVTDAASYQGLIGAGRINAYRAVQQAALLGTINVTGSITTNSSYKGSAINCSASISNNAPVLLEARREIAINPGFQVTSGCAFEMKTNATLNVCQ